MMIQFTEISKDEIYSTHNAHYHDDARYFQIHRQNVPLCIYGVIPRSEKKAEVFWINDAFTRNVVSQTFLENLFIHLFKLGFDEFYNWTRCKKLINIFNRFKKFGIEQVGLPSWDNDETKTWFMKRI